jgi:N-acetyl-anhydromuramoyl-L-alanine amidase
VRRASWHGGWWRAARRVRSPNFDERAAGDAVTLAVVHSISLPPGCYGGDAVQRLFTNRLDLHADPYYAQLEGLRVSAHFFVRRDGTTIQFVSCDARAWHAGVSNWRGRERCNDWSVGIELEGLEGERFVPGTGASAARLGAPLPDRRSGRPRACGARAQARSRAALRLARPDARARLTNRNAVLCNAATQDNPEPLDSTYSV